MDRPITYYFFNRHLSLDSLRNEYNQAMREHSLLETKFKYITNEYKHLKKYFLKTKEILYEVSSSLLDLCDHCKNIHEQAKISKEALFAYSDFLETQKSHISDQEYIELSNHLKEIYKLIELSSKSEEYCRSLDLPSPTDS